MDPVRRDAAVGEGGDWRGAAVAGAALGAALLSGGCPEGGFKPSDPHPDVMPPELPETLRRLVSRVTFGLNAREATLANDLGYGGYIEYHLDPEAIDDSALENQLGGFSTLDDTAQQIAYAARGWRRARHDRVHDGHVPAIRLQHAPALRADGRVLD